MQFLKKCCFATIAVIGLSGQIFAAAQSPQAAVLKMLETNPEVQIRWRAFEAAGFETRMARGAFLPTVDINARVGQEDRQFDNRGRYNTGQLEISLTQMLFDGFRTRTDVERLSSAQKVRYFELLAIVDSTSFEALRAYDDVKRYRALLSLIKQNYEQHLLIEEQIRQQVEQGVGRRSDLDQVVGRVALAEANLLSEASNLHDVTARYLRIVGELPADEASDLELRYNNLPDSITDVLYAAYQGNSSFHAAVTNISSTQAAVKTARSGYYPKVELRARSGLQKNLSVFDTRVDPQKYGSDSIVELALSYNLYRGGSDKAAIQRSLSLVDEAKSQRDLACVNLRQAVQIAYSDTQRIEDRLFSLRRHRDSIDNVRIAYSEQFQIGQRTLLDMLDAENEYFQASRALVEAEHELTMSHTELLSTTGGLLPALDIVQDELMFLGDGGDLASINIEASAACPAISPQSLARDDLIIASYNLEADVLFETNLASLTSRATVILQQLIKDLNITNRNIRINIEAHADSSGSEEINIPLSEARGRSVRDFLILNGLETDNMQVKGYGSSRPIGNNATAEGRRSNRRVEIIARMPSTSTRL